MNFNDRGSVKVKFRRVDRNSLPCIFYWSTFRDAFGPNGFMLFHHTAEGLHPIQRDGDFVTRRPRGPCKVSLQDPMLWELAPGGEIETIFNLLPSFNKDMLTGEKYEVVWPGNEVKEWDWGTRKEHEGKSLFPKLPAICLSAAWTTVSVRRKCIWHNELPISPSARKYE